MGEVEVSGASFWKGRTVLVTGATGLIGSWLVKDLLGRGARVVALVLDADPHSELLRSGDLARCHVVNGDLADFTARRRWSRSPTATRSRRSRRTCAARTTCSRPAASMRGS